MSASQYKPHQERVVSEHTELLVKIVKLSGFLDNLDSPDNTIEISKDERSRLSIQLRFMLGYASVLEWRIAEFGEQQ
jgi:hypothetical protein